jgi:hypothetical protein
MGGHKHPSKRPMVSIELRQAILDKEGLLKEHEPGGYLKGEPVLEHYEDGFPMSGPKTQATPGRSCMIFGLSSMYPIKSRTWAR